jgi:hypothetical protein
MYYSLAPHDQIVPIRQNKITVVIAKDILIRVLVGEMMRIVFQSQPSLEQLFARDHPGVIRIQAMSQHPPVMLQDHVNRLHRCTFFAQQAVIVLVFAAGVTEFFVYPAS